MSPVICTLSTLTIHWHAGSWLFIDMQGHKLKETSLLQLPGLSSMLCQCWSLQTVQARDVSLFKNYQYYGRFSVLHWIKRSCWHIKGHCFFLNEYIWAYLAIKCGMPIVVRFWNNKQQNSYIINMFPKILFLTKSAYR